MYDASNIHMHDVIAMLQQLQEENANLQCFMKHLPVACASIHVPTSATNSVSQVSK